jgi:hypothetical protein
VFSAERSEEARWFAPASVLGIIAIGRALQIADGFFRPEAVLWIVGALVLVAGAAVAARPIPFARFDRPAVRLFALVGIVAQIWQLCTARPGWRLPPELVSLTWFYAGVAALGIIGGSVVLGSPRWAKPLQIGGLVAVHFVLGVWMIRHSPFPNIDVNLFHRDAITALDHGIDPYGITFPNIYGPAAYYGPGISVDGRLQFGFPYPPLSLLLAWPGRLLGGDHRYAQLVSIELAACLMAFARSKGFGPLAAVLYLTTPRIFFVLQQSWTEPFVVLGLAAVVFVACRYTKAVPWLFGAFISLKQYLVFSLPAALLLMRRPVNFEQSRRLFGEAAIVAAAVTLPFFIWNPSGFWKSVVTLQLYQPFRPDALSILAWWVVGGHVQPSPTVSFVVAALASAVAVWRLPRTPAGFAAATAATFLAFFAFNKQAFCNYYFFVIGALAVTLAAWGLPDHS